VHIQPVKPPQNGGMESFNGKLRDECLNTRLVLESIRCQEEDQLVEDGI